MITAVRHPVRSLAQIPFGRRPPRSLLGLDVDRDAPDLDFCGFGWTTLERLTLEGNGGAMDVQDALVLALHTPDATRPDARELELEFWIDHDGEEFAILVSWSRFATEFVAPLVADDGPGSGRPVVLAMCNPTDAAIVRPAWLGATPLHYAAGDVVSWLDPSPPRYRLHADRWQEAA